MKSREVRVGRLGLWLIAFLMSGCLNYCSPCACACSATSSGCGAPSRGVGSCPGGCAVGSGSGCGAGGFGGGGCGNACSTRAVDAGLPDRPNPVQNDVPTCIPNCLQRACGPDPNCRESCGVCRAGFVCSMAGACQPIAPPEPARPVAPLSGSRVSSHHPRLRWDVGTDAVRARVQLCRDRDCRSIVQQFEGTSSAMVTQSLTPGAYFWRAWGQRDGIESARPSAVWVFFVGAEDSPIPSVIGAASDFNADGFADVAIASAGPVEQQGFVDVYHGGNDGLSAAPVVTLRSRQPGDGFAVSVANAGDVNGDGYTDLVVGASRALLGGDAQGATGKAVVYYGGSLGLSAVPSSEVFPLANTQRFGYVVAGAGDANADGYADVVVISDDDVVLYLGSQSGLRSHAFGHASRPRPTDEVRTFAPVADLDFDDHSDFLLTNDLRADGTRATVFAGETGWAHPAQTQPVVFATMSTSLSAAGIGDINGDGFADLAIGDPRTGSGRVGIFAGNERASFLVPAQTIDATGSLRQFGWDLAGVGDVNGDGFDDVAIGSPGTIGPVQPAGDAGVEADGGSGERCEVGAFSLHLGGRLGLQMNANFTVQNELGCDRFGYVVSSMGDVNRDGYGDFVVTAPLATVGGAPQAGRAWIFFGGDPVVSTPARVIEGTQDNQRLGFSVASR